MMQLIKNLSEPKNLLIVCVTYTAIITFLFLVPISTSPTRDLPIDKLVHLLFNAALLFLWLHYFNNKKWLNPTWAILLIFFFAIIYGILIEFFQEHLTTSRNADVWDVVANTTGCLIGLLIFNNTKKKYIS